MSWNVAQHCTFFFLQMRSGITLLCDFTIKSGKRQQQENHTSAVTWLLSRRHWQLELNCQKQLVTKVATGLWLWHQCILVTYSQFMSSMCCGDYRKPSPVSKHSGGQFPCVAVWQSQLQLQRLCTTPGLQKIFGLFSVTFFFSQPSIFYHRLSRTLRRCWSLSQLS